MSSKKSENTTIEPSEISGDELSGFKQKVAKWCEIDNKIKQYNTVIKNQKKLKDDLCVDILEFMESYEISDLATPYGKIQRVASTTKEPITRDLIEKRVESYFNKLGVKNSKEQSQTLIKDLYENREKKTTMRLRRNTPRAKKTADTEDKSIVPESLKKI
jgi:hypothetical protein